MNVSRYEIILKIVETGSFTKTAEYFQYTQSAISQIVKSIEDEFKIPLFRRLPGKVILSEEGKSILPFIEKIVTEQMQLSEHLGNLASSNSGIIRLGGYLSVSCHFIPPCIKDFKKIYPNIEFKLYQEDDATLIDLLTDGRVDLLIMSNPNKREFAYQELFQDPFFAVVPKGHFPYEMEDVSLKQLKHENFITLNVGYGAYLNEMFKIAGIRPAIKYRMIDDTSILSMVEQGLGISILPEFVTLRTSFQIDLIKIKPLYTRSLGIVTRKNDHLSWSVKKFMEFAAGYTLG